MKSFEEMVRAGELVAVLPLFVENTIEGGFEPAMEETILAQPCVQAALKKAYADGRKAGWDQGFADACEEED